MTFQATTTATTTGGVINTTTTTNKTVVAIRPAQLDDLETLKEFEQGVVSAERPFDQTLKKEGDGTVRYYDLKKLIESKDSQVLVATTTAMMNQPHDAHDEDDSNPQAAVKKDVEVVIGSGYIEIRKAAQYERHALYGHIGCMYVKPEYRGKGIVQTIYNGLIQWLKIINDEKKRDTGGDDEGGMMIKEVRLDVYSDNIPAIKAYEKVGFQKLKVQMRTEI